jgi:hypothetical protein
MNETATTEGELDEPWFVKNDHAMKLLAVRPSYYWGLVRQRKIIVVGKGRGSRASLSSLRAYAAELLAEATSGKAA